MEVGQTYTIPAYNTTNAQFAQSSGAGELPKMVLSLLPCLVELFLQEVLILHLIVAISTLVLNFANTDDNGATTTANIVDIEFIGFQATVELDDDTAEELTDVGSLS